MFNFPNVRFHGPPRYCPDCGRLLLEVDDDGHVDLAPDAGFTARGEGDPQAETCDGVIIEAECYECHPELREPPPPPQRFQWLWRQPKS